MDLIGIKGDSISYRSGFENRIRYTKTALQLLSQWMSIVKGVHSNSIHDNRPSDTATVYGWEVVDGRWRAQHILELYLSNSQKTQPNSATVHINILPPPKKKWNQRLQPVLVIRFDKDFVPTYPAHPVINSHWLLISLHQHFTMISRFIFITLLAHLSTTVTAYRTWGIPNCQSECHLEADDCLKWVKVSHSSTHQTNLMNQPVIFQSCWTVSICYW